MFLIRRVIIIALAPACLLAFGSSVARTAPPELTSAVFEWSDLKPEPTAVGEVRRVFQNPTATLEELRCHITTLKAGTTSHPPHVHGHEELLIVREGNVELFYKGGWHPAGPGSVIFLTGTDPHGIRNAGTTPATYHVLAWRAPGTRPVGRARAD
jgi:quercetin dioxygenase-like cupin family protein